MARDSFILYNSFWKPLSRLSNEQKGRLLEALFRYAIEGADDVAEDIALAFDFIRNQMDLDAEKYAATCEKRRDAARLGGLQKAANLANGSKCYQMLPKVAYNDNVNDNENEKENKNDVSVDTNARTRAEKPTHTEILKILFFRNIRNAETEAAKLLQYYDTTEWTLSGGDVLRTAAQKLGRAELWNAEDKRPRFPVPFLDVWARVYEALPDATKPAALRDATRARMKAGFLEIFCAPEIRSWCEGSATAGEILSTVPGVSGVRLFSY